MMSATDTTSTTSHGGASAPATNNPNKEGTDMWKKVLGWIAALGCGIPALAIAALFGCGILAFGWSLLPDFNASSPTAVPTPGQTAPAVDPATGKPLMEQNTDVDINIDISWGDELNGKCANGANCRRDGANKIWVYANGECKEVCWKQARDNKVRCTEQKKQKAEPPTTFVVYCPGCQPGPGQTVINNPPAAPVANDLVASASVSDSGNGTGFRDFTYSSNPSASVRDVVAVSDHSGDTNPIAVADARSNQEVAVANDNTSSAAVSVEQHAPVVVEGDTIVYENNTYIEGDTIYVEGDTYNVYDIRGDTIVLTDGHDLYIITSGGTELLCPVCERHRREGSMPIWLAPVCDLYCPVGPGPVVPTATSSGPVVPTATSPAGPPTHTPAPPVPPTAVAMCRNVVAAPRGSVVKAGTVAIVQEILVDHVAKHNEVWISHRVPLASDIIPTDKWDPVAQRYEQIDVWYCADAPTSAAAWPWIATDVANQSCRVYDHGPDWAAGAPIKVNYTDASGGWLVRDRATCR